MEGRRTERFRVTSTWNGLTQLVILSICFIVGALGGFFFSAAIGERQELIDYLQRYFQQAGNGEGRVPSLLVSVWEVFRWPVITTFLGMTSLGVAGIPLLLIVRGFMLSFAVATFSHLFGLPGLAVAATVFCLTILIAVPVLFVTSQAAFRQSLTRLSETTLPTSVWNRQLLLQLPCLSLLILMVALQQTVIPTFIAAVCASLFIS